MSKLSGSSKEAWLVIKIAGHSFALSVMEVQGVLRQFECTPVPLASTEIIGTMNLRGRIVTMVDIGYRLGFGSRGLDYLKMGVVVEVDSFLYCFLVDEVGDVMVIPQEEIYPLPGNVGSELKRYATNVHRMDDCLLVLLDTFKLLDYENI